MSRRFNAKPSRQGRKPKTWAVLIWFRHFRHSRLCAARREAEHYRRAYVRAVNHCNATARFYRVPWEADASALALGTPDAIGRDWWGYQKVTGPDLREPVREAPPAGAVTA